jgi:hypothetical protein
MSAPAQAEHVSPAPRWVAPFFAVLGLALVPWTVWLAYDLPRRHIARHWDVAWAGFDVMMALVLLATAYAALRRRPWIQGTASAAATMLCCDAWFDIVTAGRGADLAMSLASGLFVELPLAVVCVWVARNAEKAQEYLFAAGRLRRRRVHPG